MSEKFPTIEREPVPTRQEVIEGLLANPEDLSLIHSYLDKRESEVTNSKETLELNVEIAEIYRDAGLIQAARESFEDAAEQAWHEQDDELYKHLMAELEKLPPIS